MSNPAEPLPALLMMSLIYTSEADTRTVISHLEEEFGECGTRSCILPFDNTDYYTEEMGKDLQRMFIYFRRIIPQEGLVEVKLKTNEIEKEHLNQHGGRRINIDPGILTMERLILATGKNYTHRIYLGRGIYADLTLIYNNGSFRPLRWTYPDYASPRIIEIINEFRKDYKEKVKRFKIVN